MTTEEFLTEARRLRQIADDAECEFLEFLYQGEGQPSIWADTGYTFDEFITRNHLCDPLRYQRYKRTREALGPQEIRGVGAHAIIAAGSFRDPRAQREIIVEARTWERTNGTSISKRSAQHLARDVRTRQAAARSRHKTYAQLEAENHRLRAQVEELKKRNAELRGELAALRKAPKSKRRKRKAAS